MGFSRLALLVPAVALFAACDSDQSPSAALRGSAGFGADRGRPTGGDTEPASMAGITERHNLVRSNVSPAASPPLSPLVWSSELAAIAQSYADKCVFEHSRGGKLGENLYAGSGGDASGPGVVDDWASESAAYNFANDECAKGKQCGHYTQVVWRGTQRVGCGAAQCKVGSPFGDTNDGAWQNWVCNYDPPGNFIGEQPY